MAKYKLFEVEYEKIFKPETIAALKGKSKESLKQMLGNKSLMQTLLSIPNLLEKISAAETDYIDELEMIAVQIVKDAYPIIDYANIQIDGKIVQGSATDLAKNNLDNEENKDEVEDAPENYKRRVINGITQGSAIRGAFAFLIFKDYLDELNPSLVNDYKEIMNSTLGVYDSDDFIAMLLAALAQGQKQAGGTSEVEYDDENQNFVIKARALNFPMLVYEIVKGLYEIVGTQGFGADKEKNQKIVNQVDRLDNEPNDLQIGKFIYDAISDLYIQSDIDDPRVRELLFTEIYKLDEDEFLEFVENAINNKLTTSQKQWTINTMKDIKSDLSKDDTGLQDLD